MAGGAGVEYYFGYQLPQNDLVCEDLRSRDHSWDYCRIALDFFRENRIPFWAMHVRRRTRRQSTERQLEVLLRPTRQLYVVYLPNGGSTDLDLETNAAPFRVQWYNPRAGGALQSGAVREVKGPGKVALGPPPADGDQDWAVLVRK